MMIFDVVVLVFDVDMVLMLLLLLLVMCVEWDVNLMWVMFVLMYFVLGVGVVCVFG